MADDEDKDLAQVDDQLDDQLDEHEDEDEDEDELDGDFDLSGVAPEIGGIRLVHHAIRYLLQVSARDAGIDPDRGSVSRALRAARRQVTDQAGLSPLPTTPRHPTSGR